MLQKIVGAGFVLAVQCIEAEVFFLQLKKDMKGIYPQSEEAQKHPQTELN